MFIIPSLAGGGAEKVLVLILRHLDSARFEPVVVVFSAINDYKEEITPYVRIISLNKKSRFDNLRLVPALSSVIKEERPDLICSFLYYTNYISVLARKMSRLSIPLVLTEHGVLSLMIKEARFLDLTRMLVKKLYPSADCVVAVSKGVKDDLVANFGILEGHTFIVNNSVEFERVQLLGKEELKHQWFSEDVPVVVACGRLTRAKNYPLLLSAVAQVLKSVPVRLVILGDGEQKQELKSMAEKLGIQESVQFMGFQTNPFRFMSRASVFVLSSSYEGFGNVIIEAMACGAPVVSTRCPSGPEEIITDGVNGILTPVDNEMEMAGAILKLLRDRAFRDRIIAEGKKRVLDFDIKGIVEKYEDLFESLTGGKRSVEMLRHLVLVGLNYQQRRSTGDKNFWVELVQSLSSHLKEITIFSIRKHETPEEIHRVNGCLVRIKYIRPKFLETPDAAYGKRFFWKNGRFPAKLGILEKLLNTRVILSELDNLYRQSPYQHIHLMDNMGFMNRIIAGKSRTSVSVSAMAYQAKEPKMLYEKYLAASYDHKKLTVVPYSEAYRKKLISLGINAVRVRRVQWGTKVLPGCDNGDASAKQAREKLKVTPHLPIILWSGYIQQIGKKDFLFAYNAAKKALESGLKAVFFFAFKPESFKKGFELFNEPGKHIFVKSTDVNDFFTIRQASDIFFSPVTNDKCILAPPLTWIEMLSQGTPIVTSSVPGASEAVIDGKTGYLAKTEDEIIEKLFLAVSNFKNMKKKCMDMVALNYNINDVSHKYIELIKILSYDFQRSSQCSLRQEKFIKTAT